MIPKHITYAIIFLCLPLMTVGQKKKQTYKSKMENFRVKKKDFKKNRYFAAGGSLNFMTYFGDLAPTENFFSTDISQIKPGVSAQIQYYYGPRMSLKAELMYGRLTGDDFSSASPDRAEERSRYLRNLSFRNDIIDFSVMSRIHIFKNYLEFKERKFFNIYFTGGISIFYHNPKGKVPDFDVHGRRYPNSGKWVALRPLGTEGQQSAFYDKKPYSKIQFSIPVGGGFNFKLTDRLDFSLEFNYRFLLTDYIDDVSGRYVDLGALDSEMARSMSDRSREEYAAITGQERDLTGVELVTYVSKYDGNRYTVISGYGAEGGSRGGSGKDTYFVTSFKISYIIQKRKQRDK